MDVIAIVLFVCLIILLVQDLKHREIHIILPVLVFACSFLIARKNGADGDFTFLYNIGFFTIILITLVAYMSIKNKSFLNPFTNYFGLGDVLFFIAITPLFTIRNYILFFIMSMLFSITAQLAFRKKMRDKTVPLAGFSSLFLVLIMLKDIVLDFKSITLIQ